MKKTTVTFIVAVIAVAASFPALARSAGAQPPCLHRSEIRDFRIARDNRSILVQDNARKIYTVKLSETCHFLSERIAIRFVSFNQTRLSCLETGDGVAKTSDFGMTPRCTIKSIEYFQPENDLHLRNPRGAG